MVDPIGVKTVTTADVPAPRVATTPVNPTPPPTAATGADTAQSAATALARTLAAEPPVDPNRVAEIRRAIANGTFPILPATIADRLLALRMEWNSNDKA